MNHYIEDRTWIKEFYDAAAEWWGFSWYEGENLQPRLERVERFAGSPPKRLLELAAGTGETAAFLAAAGYAVTALDLSAKNYELMSQVAAKYPLLTALQGDYLTAAIPGTFDAVCLFESFGLGSDREQRQLLQRIAAEWLAPGGVIIMDVYHPFGPIRLAGTAQSLDRLEDVPGSVDMTERSYYDAVLGRWIDEWEPVENIAAARRQSIRCYTPADLLLLLEGTGFEISHAEFAGQAFDPAPAQVSVAELLQDFQTDYTYTVILRRK
ncbi:MAG: class I SAM-dependent methyltransferase [Anaerolineae bacterium]|jgi:SAM-dependent methyltransferase|nr:class I SAM-dependent methyltransferase [Anaerolineae bacterium]